MTTHTIEGVDRALQTWGHVWRQASDQICRISLLGLAIVAAEHGVITLELGWSDQGDYLTVDKVECAEGSDEDEAYDAIIDECFAAGDLRGEWQDTWAGFVESDDRGESFKLDVAHVLSALDDLELTDA